MESYVPLEILGEGGFGTVFKARNEDTGEMVAVKALNDSNVFELQEVIAMRSLPPHANLLRLKDALCHDGKSFLILELMECSVKKLLKLHGGMDEVMVRDFAWQLLKGLSHIHKFGLMHLDLKPDNLLLDSDGVLKISDFGAARPDPLSAAGAAESVGCSDLYSVLVGTLWYNAPEILSGAPRYGAAVDLWSVGCVMAELFSGKTLFPGEDLDRQMPTVRRVIGWRREGLYLENLFTALSLTTLLPSASTQAVQLIASLLTLDPAMRPTALDAMRHAFFEPCRQAETLVSSVPASIDVSNRVPEIPQQVPAASVASEHARLVSNVPASIVSHRVPDDQTMPQVPAASVASEPVSVPVSSVPASIVSYRVPEMPQGPAASVAFECVSQSPHQNQLLLPELVWLSTVTGRG